MSKHIYWLFATLLLVVSCQDDIITPEDYSFDLSETEVTLQPHARSYTLTIKNRSIEDMSSLRVSCDVSWINIAETVSDDGIIEFWVDDNAGMTSRSANISVVEPGTDFASSCALKQLGLGDNDINSSEFSTFLLGCGYNIFYEFNSRNSATSLILDESKMESCGIKNILQYAPHNDEKVTHITSSSANEMANLMEREQTESSRVLFCSSKKTIDRFVSSTYNLAETYFCYIKLKRSVAVGTIDVGKLQYCIDNNIDVFTNDFSRMRDNIIANYGNTDAIDNMLTKYGTHVVVNADLGGMIDLTLNFSRSMKGEINMRAEDFSSYFFSHDNSDYLNNGTVEGLITDMSKDGAVAIMGGSESTVNAIRNGLKGSGNAKRITAANLLAWQRSIEGNPLLDKGLLKRLAPINFRLLPIWALFPQDPALQNAIFARVLAFSQRSNNKISDTSSNLDVYRFDLNSASFMKFTNHPDSTLVKVVYASNGSGALKPALEVCNEYVPKLRGDKRVNVIYAIRNGRPFHGAGLFPGDGEGNPPAWLTFSDGDCYVMPIADMSINTTINTVYYIHGNIYIDNLGMDVKLPQEMAVESHYLKFNQKYPIVKIGSGYWTRKYLKEKLYFGYTYRNKFYTQEELIDGTLFANIYESNDKKAQTLYGEFFGQDMDNIYEKSTRWYLPLASDRVALTKYLGNNLKSLFKNQVTGFEADFVGYFGDYDLSGNVFSDRTKKRRMNGEICVIPFKAYTTADNGEAMILTQNYTWSRINTKTKVNFYPVRLFRTSYFTYKEK